MKKFEIIQGDSRVVSPVLPGNHFQTIITSPPYGDIRNYGGRWVGGDSSCAHVLSRSRGGLYCAKCGANFDTMGQIGFGQTPKEYMGSLVEVFEGLKRALHPTGTLWVVIGDSYAGSGRGSSGNGGTGTFRGTKEKGQSDQQGFTNIFSGGDGLKPKDLIGYPYMLAFALRDAGWYWRSIITWSKLRCKPESVKDRPTTSSERVLVFSREEECYCDEYILLFSKRRNYFYDQEAIREPYSESSVARLGQKWTGGQQRGYPGSANVCDVNKAASGAGKNKWDVWHDEELEETWARMPVWGSATSSRSDDHYAVYPEHLISPMVLAGTSEAGCCAKCRAPWRRVIDRGEDVGGVEFEARVRDGAQPLNAPIKPNGPGGYGYGRPVVLKGWAPSCKCGADPVPCAVLDPFSGTGTTGAVALKLGREYTGIELFDRFCDVSRERLAGVEEGLGEMTAKRAEEFGRGFQLGIFAEE